MRLAGIRTLDPPNFVVYPTRYVLYRGYQLSVQYWVQYKIQNSIQNFGVKNDRIKNFKLQTPDQERMLKFRMFRKTRLFQIISVQRHVRRGCKNTLTVTTIDPPPLLLPTDIPRLYNKFVRKLPLCSITSLITR